ncbi:hypothetical protein TRFO_35706 [Tritrichomonas foetus]|uniref:Tetraspanin family protein n=1 Tax=Tritrichomonas foetus TaxID=1144522 RepID=A0A1J4JFL9_9EUKA|nr:hypothetical protein TRFO_35706 [Tritrichomonas foetus]|eukprot:OHS98014.1 hypothetical protein TRFO_35706 [Tritrichomonas foetus]
MVAFSPCSMALLIAFALFMLMCIVTTIVSFVFSIFYLKDITNLIPHTCSTYIFTPTVVLMISIVLFLIFAGILSKITQSFMKKLISMAPFVVTLIFTITFFIVIFVSTILITKFSSDKYIQQQVTQINEKIFNSESKCFDEIQKLYNCSTKNNCSEIVGQSVPPKIQAIHKSSFYLSIFIDGSFIVALICIAWYYTPCPCGPIHDMNRV